MTRTDFSSRGVPLPVLGELVTHVCDKGHRYAGGRCPLCTKAKMLTARQWRRMEAEAAGARTEGKD